MPSTLIQREAERARVGIPGDPDFEICKMATRHPPGTPGKERVLMLRAFYGVELWNPRDAIRDDRQQVVSEPMDEEDDDLELL